MKMWKGKADVADEENIPIATVVGVVIDTKPPATKAASTLAANKNRASAPLAIVPMGSADPQAVVPVSTMNNNRTQRLNTNMGRQPFGLQCPHCNRETITIVDDRIGVATIVLVVVLAFVFWPCCWIPFCVPSCKQTNHFCGHDSCRRKVGVTGVCA
mmetsp:Transcript_26726/g.62459  ORF Transcript_26726/g.62459 Transcript_26726/m.62459 type:complete len:157 (-) Transcript_26726:2261-2731(-)